MRARLSMLSLLAVPLSTACAFLLDFDDLQSENAPVTDGGSSGGGASADSGAGGANADSGPARDSGAGGGPSCDECPDDGDLCTIEECTPEGCRTTRESGLVPDGFDETLTFDAAHRVTMTARGNRAYLSVFFEDAGVYETRITSIDDASTEVPEGVAVSSLGDFMGARPVSAAGLVAAEPGFDLDAFVAIGDQPEQGVVIRLTFGLDLSLMDAVPVSSTSDPLRVYAGHERLYPIAWRPPGGDVSGAWPVSGGGVEVYTDAQLGPATSVLGSANGLVTALAPMSAGNAPAVLYATAAGELRAQAIGQIGSSLVQQCDTTPGLISSVTAGYTAFEGIYFTAWSKYHDEGFFSETKGILCQQGALTFCAGGAACEAPGEVQQWIRNSVFDFLRLQGDAPERVYQVAAGSALDPGATDGIVFASVVRIELSADSLTEPTITPVTREPVELGRAPLGPDGEGPDWPALAVLPPNRVVFAWIEAGPGGDEVHVARRRICFPE